METKVKKVKKFKYHNFLRFTFIPDGSKHQLATQLYKLGVYGIWDNNSGEQACYTPSQLESNERKLRKLEAEGKIKDLEFGREIVVSDETGFWEEVSGL